MSKAFIYFRSNAQFPAVANAIWGKESYLPGIKKIVGGILAADITHSKCGQKMLCDEMAPEVSLLDFLIKINASKHVNHISYLIQI